MLRKSSVQINSTKIIIVAFLVANHARNVINTGVCSVILPQLSNKVVAAHLTVYHAEMMVSADSVNNQT